MPYQSDRNAEHGIEAPPPKYENHKGIEVDDGNQYGAQQNDDFVYRDPCAAVAFIVNLLISLGLGAFATATCDWNDLTTEDEESETPSPTMDPDDIQRTALEASAITIVGLILSIALAYLSLYAAEKCTKCLLYSGAVLIIFFIIVLFILSDSFLLVIIGVLLVGYYIYLLFQKDSIEFAIWVVQTSCKVLKEYGGVIRLSFMWMVLQAAVVIGYFCFAMTVSAVFGQLLAIYMIFSLWWGEEVLSNILGVTVSSVAAFWATEISNIDGTRPVSASFYYSITYSFGSICLGSLIVALLKTIRLLARMAMNAGGDSGFSRVIILCCNCFLAYIEWLIEYFNEWAYAYVAMYRKDFRTSAQYVWNLLRTNGWEAVVNDIYTDMVTFLPPILSAIIIAVVFALYGQFVVEWNSSGVIFGAFVGLILGFVLCNTVMRTIGRVQNVIFLSYLEKRNTFAGKHPELVGQLEQKFRLRYPDIHLMSV